MILAEATDGTANGLSTLTQNGKAGELVFLHADSDGATAPGAARAATAGDAAQEDGPEIRVADIRKHRHDGRGEKIDSVLILRRDFAIYRSGGRVMVHYADDAEAAKAQIANVANLLPLKDRVQYLASGLASPEAYHWQIAEALRLGLDGQTDAAKSTMQGAIDDIIARRVSKGRVTYLFYSGLLALATVLTLWGVALVMHLARSSVEMIEPGMKFLMMATGAGAVGAFLSTVIALRARTLATDGDLKSNRVDSTMRIMIGVICAAVLYLVMDSNLLAGVAVGGATLSVKITWQIALLTGFAAGFLERLVPDLLEKKLGLAIN